MPESSSPRRSVDLRHPRLIGASAMALFSIASLLSWRAGEGMASMVFLVFVALGLYLLLGSGHIAADDDAISVISVLGRHALAWERVRNVETSGYGTLVLHADNARLVVPPPMLWSGPDKQALRALIARRLRERSLTAQRSVFADFRLHKHARVTSEPPHS